MRQGHIDDCNVEDIQDDGRHDRHRHSNQVGGGSARGIFLFFPTRCHGRSDLCGHNRAGRPNAETCHSPKRTVTSLRQKQGRFQNWSSGIAEIPFQKTVTEHGHPPEIVPVFICFICTRSPPDGTQGMQPASAFVQETEVSLPRSEPSAPAVPQAPAPVQHPPAYWKTLDKISGRAPRHFILVQERAGGKKKRGNIRDIPSQTHSRYLNGTGSYILIHGRLAMTNIIL